jgi:hypothetical protein
MNELILVCVMVLKPISTAYLRNPSHQSVCLNVYPPIVSRQRLGKNVTAAMNTHATIAELLGASFSMRSVSYQGKYAISSSQIFLFKFGYLTTLTVSEVYTIEGW